MYRPSTSPTRHRGATLRSNLVVLLTGALVATGVLVAGAGPATASGPARSAQTSGAPAGPSGAGAGRCVPTRPGPGFYAGGQVASEEVTTPNSRCTTISVSDIQDVANPADRCQTFKVGLWPLVDGSLTYTEPVVACGRHQTVLARNVPGNTRYIVLYAIDYLDPEIQHVEFLVWH